MSRIGDKQSQKGGQRQEKEMICETIDLYEYFGMDRKGDLCGILRSYRHGQIPEMQIRKIRPAMLVLPGGGYEFVSQREADPVALQYFAQGFDCFVLTYDVAPHRHYPTPVLQAGMAMLYLRREAAKLDLDEGHIAAVGFSAGGHLCGVISLLWDDPAFKEKFGEECVKIRPDASVYSYPVITCAEAISHGGSFDNLCADVVRREDYSLEKKVRPAACPSFIWSTTTDSAVPVENSLLLYTALHKANVPVELHLFEKGPHGMSTCDGEVNRDEPSDPAYRHVKNWLPLSFEFLKEHGFAVRSEK